MKGILRYLLLSALILLAVEKSQAQTTGDFCIPSVGCYTSFEKAEAALRAQPSYAGIGQYLEHVNTALYVFPTLIFTYDIKYRPAASLSGPGFRADLGLAGSGIYGCQPPPADSNLDPAAYCANETSLVSAVEAELTRKWNSETVTCTITATTVTSNYGPAVSVTGSNSIERGTVVYGTKKFNTKANCNSGPNKNFNWNIIQHKKIYCDSGFRPLTTSNLTEERLLTDLICKPYNTSSANFRAPLKQCKSCPGSKNPIYPATGEKVRAEPDFMFAGRTFTRHYRSWRQLRNNPYFGIGWTHTFSDRLDRAGKVVFSDTGDVEAFNVVLANRYRGQNSFDNILEYINQGGVSYRLTLPDGEIKEFDTEGKLLRVRTLEDPSKDVTLAYANGVLISATDAKGRILKFFYTDNMVSVIQLPDGRDIHYKYDTRQNLTLVEYGNGEKRKYHYAEPALVGDPEQVHKLTGISNVVGTVETRFANFQYDNQGRATSSTVLGSPDEVASVTYDSANQATMTTESGATKVYTMGPGSYRPITNISVSGGVGDISRLYDSQKRVKSETNSKGITSTFEYPTEYTRRIISAEGTPEQRTIELDRNASNLVTQTRVFDGSNVLQSKTTWAYNSRGQVLSETSTNVLDNSTRTDTKTYCESSDVTDGTCPIVGLLKSESNSGSLNTTSYKYRQNDEASCSITPAACPYRKGDLWKVTNSLNHVSEIVSYDGAGRVLATKNHNGVVTEFEYDFKGRKSAIRVKGSDGDRVTTMTYTSTNEIKQINNPDGTFIKYNYDDADRLTSMEDNLGNKIIYTLNEDGKVEKEEIEDSGGIPRKTLAFTYNNLSQMTAIKNAESQSGGNPTLVMTYDSEGYLEKTTDALNRQSTKEYDSLGRIKKLIQDANGLLPQEVNQQYSALDKVTEVKDPKNLDTNSIYNGFGDLGQVDSPDSGSTGYDYNSLGQLIEKTNGNGVVEQYTYDVLGRIITRNYEGDDIDETYTYDVSQADCVSGEQFGVGKLTRVADGSGSKNLCYNSYGDLVRSVQRTNGKTFVVRWIYGSNGQLNEMVYPSGMIVDYVYNNLGQASELGVTIGSTRQVLLTGASYYPFGPIAGWEYGNGREMRRDYNLNYSPLLIQDLASGGINYEYSYDTVGNLTRLQAPGLVRNYEYDGLNRLNVVRNSSNVKLWEYTYDATGNRTSFTQGASATKNYTYQSSSHRLLNDSLESRGYDGTGNLVGIRPNGSGPGQFRLGFAYNTANRLRNVFKGGTSESASYFYNYKGERVQRSLATAVSDENYYYVYNSTSLIGEYDGAGVAVQQMIWLDTIPVGVVTGIGSSAKLYYVQADGLGTPRVVIDPVRNLAVWKNPLEAEPFGSGQPLADPDGDAVNFEFNLRFSGQLYDSFSGLVYNYFRDYDSSTGRYVQSDPLGLEGGISTYSYVESNPLNSVDPMGLLKGVPGTITVVPPNPPVITVGNPNPLSSTYYSPLMQTAVQQKYQRDFDIINSAGKKYPFTPYTPEDMYQLLYIDRCLDVPAVEPDSGIDCTKILIEIREAHVNMVMVHRSVDANRMTLPLAQRRDDKNWFYAARASSHNLPLREQILKASYRLERAIARADKYGCPVPPSARAYIENVLPAVLESLSIKL